MGPDDQLPDHDGEKFFRPFCVAQHLSEGSGVWNYAYYCGRCRKKMGMLGQTKEFCPRCGAGIAHYIFAMGVIDWKPPDWRHDLPTVLPEFFDVHGYFCGTEAERLLSGGTVNARTSHGHG